MMRSPGSLPPSQHGGVKGHATIREGESLEIEATGTREKYKVYVVLTYNVQCHVVYTAYRTVVHAGVCV